MSRKYDVFGIGTALVDYFVRSDDDLLAENGLTKGATNFMPREKLDELHSELSRSIFACFPGDNARNVCEGISFMGGRSAYASRIARDAEGEIFESCLGEQNIDSFLEKKPGRTGKIIAFITPDFQRTFATDLGNSVKYDALPSEGIKDSSFLYLTSITLLTNGKVSESARKAMKLAKESDVRVSISLESPPMVKKNMKRTLKLLSGSNVLFANEDELEALTGSRGEKAARTLADDVGTFYLKKGSGGSVVFSEGKRFEIQASRARVVDTTGAGDFYAAGTLFGLSRGQPVDKAGRQGTMLATKVIGKFGATLHG